MHDETVEVEKLAAERFRATHDRLTGIYNIPVILFKGFRIPGSEKTVSLRICIDAVRPSASGLLMTGLREFITGSIFMMWRRRQYRRQNRALIVWYVRLMVFIAI